MFRKSSSFLDPFRTASHIKGQGNETVRLLGKFLTVVAILTSAGCGHEVGTQISIDGLIPPSFSFNGTGNQIEFLISRVPPENRTIYPYHKTDKDIVLWRIVPAKGTPDQARVWPSVTYGKVPPGFVQNVPQNGDPPPGLVEGEIYSAGGLAYNAPGGQLFFIISNGKSMDVPITYLVENKNKN
jgi:hypothetical protein